MSNYITMEKLKIMNKACDMSIEKSVEMFQVRKSVSYKFDLLIEFGTKA